MRGLGRELQIGPGRGFREMDASTALNINDAKPKNCPKGQIWNQRDKDETSD